MLLVPLATGPFLLVVLMVGLPQLTDATAVDLPDPRGEPDPGDGPGRSRWGGSRRACGWSAGRRCSLGTIVGGILGETIGPRGAMLIGGVGMLPAVLWLLWSPIRDLRSMPAASPAP